MNKIKAIIQKFQLLRALHKQVMEEIRKEALK